MGRETIFWTVLNVLKYIKFRHVEVWFCFFGNDLGTHRGRMRTTWRTENTVSVQCWHIYISSRRNSVEAQNGVSYSKIWQNYTF